MPITTTLLSGVKQKSCTCSACFVRVEELVLSLVSLSLFDMLDSYDGSLAIVLCRPDRTHDGMDIPLLCQAHTGIYSIPGQGLEEDQTSLYHSETSLLG